MGSRQIEATAVREQHPAAFPFPVTQREESIVELTNRLSTFVGEHAAEHDGDGSFPFESFEAIRDSGYLTYAVPEAYGGVGATAREMVLGQEQLARGDGSVALGTTMHHMAVRSIVQSPYWTESLRKRVLEDVAKSGALINSIASEPDLGSPSRGGAFKTLATRKGDGWVINGRKTWSTLSPALTYAIAQVSVQEHPDDVPQKGMFLVPMDSPGISIVETWDGMAMRASGSHDVLLDEVFVPDEYRIILGDGPPHGSPSAWNLMGSAVYLGVANAARDYAVEFARERKPTALQGKSIATIQTVQQRIAQIEVLQMAAKSVLYETVAMFESFPDRQKEFQWRIAATKHLVTNNAIDITDQALRVVGAAGLSRSKPLERYFRDVRAGLGNPPLDDVAMTTVGKAALGLS